MSVGNPAAKRQLPFGSRSSSSSAYVKHSITPCGSKCNINCYSSTFAILSTLFSLNSLVLANIYIYI